MLFSSTIFLFVFLPIVLILYYGPARKENTRNLILLLSSLIFYAWGEPKFVLVMLLCIGANYVFGYLIDKYRGEKNKTTWILVGMLIFNLSILGIFKYAGFIVENLNLLLHIALPVPKIVLPIGISFFTFQSISYVIDVYREKGKALKNPLDVGLYVALFPQLIAGPIVRYETIANEIHGRKETESDFTSGIVRFILGLSKKVLLSNQFALIADKVYNTGAGNLSVTFAWLGAICYMLQIYFDFSGYSDMAIGLGRMFGFHFNENFNLPYTAKSVSDFWRRWHISLSTWFRDYVYFPMGGSRVNSKLKLGRNLLVVWCLTGIWHGANWTFIVWGLYFGIILIIEKFTGLDKWMEKSKVMGHFYTLLIVVISWVLFRAANIGEAINFIKDMFGISHNRLVDGLASFYIKESLAIIIIGIMASLPIVSWVKGYYLKQKSHIQKTYQIVGMCVLAMLFFVAVAYLVKGTYNPFIYFNF